jgi:hypothetical protein
MERCTPVSVDKGRIHRKHYPGNSKTITVMTEAAIVQLRGKQW